MNESLKSRIAEAARILRAAGAKEVYVFGSAAEESAVHPHDVDLAVSGLPPAVFYEACAAAGGVLPLPLDLVDLDEDNPIVRYLKEEGELVRVG